jgi:hypothetical protein
MIKKINKKADMLPEEVLRIILGVIGIVLLMYLAVSLYGIFLSKTKLEQAKSTLEAIVGKAEISKAGENLSYVITAPRDWVIYVFNNTQNSPGDCEKSFCLCTCPKFLTKSDEIINLCEKEGVCQKSKTGIFTKNLLGDYFILKNLPKTIYIKNEESKVYLLSSLNSINQKDFEEIFSSEEMKNLIVGICRDISNKTAIVLLENTLNSRLGSENWLLKIELNSKPVIQIVPDKIDSVTFYKMSMEDYPMKSFSFNKENQDYTLKLKTEQKE